MSAAIAGTPAIALSWGLMTGYKPPTRDLIDGALTASCQVISKLWELGFPEQFLLYTVNIPVSPRCATHHAPLAFNLARRAALARATVLIPSGRPLTCSVCCIRSCCRR